MIFFVNLFFLHTVYITLPLFGYFSTLFHYFSLPSSSYLVGKVFIGNIEFFVFDHDSLPISFQSGITFPLVALDKISYGIQTLDRAQYAHSVLSFMKKKKDIEKPLLNEIKVVFFDMYHERDHQLQRRVIQLPLGQTGILSFSNLL